MDKTKVIGYTLSCIEHDSLSFPIDFPQFHQGLYIGYDSISVLSQSVSLLQAYLLLELSSSSLLAGTGGNRRRPALWYLMSAVWVGTIY